MSAAERQEGLAAVLPTRARAGGRMWELDVIGRVWRFFTSVRLALILILMIAAAVMAGTLIDQAPPSVVSNAAAYDSWLAVAHSKYGIWANFFEFTQLFNVFHSLWFRILIALLTANIIVCTANRWKGIWTTVFHTRTRMGDAFFQHARFNAAMTAQMPVGTAAERVRKAFSHARYRVATQADESSVAIFADRNRLSRFGTFLSHLSLVMILAGTVIGGIWGFSDNQFIVSEGAIRDVGRGTGISVGLDHFTDEYYLEGPPKDYSSELVIYDNGVEVKRGTVHVNSPLNYKGISFHQAFFGQTAVMDVKDGTGASLFSAGVPLAWQSLDGGRPIGSFTLAAQNETVYVTGPTSGENDPVIPAGEMQVEVYQTNGTLVTSGNVTQGVPKDLAGLNFTFVRESRFTGLKVVKDPGVNLIWIAAALMVIGLVMLFYFPPKRIWAICKQRPDGTAEVRLATTADRDLSQTKDFENMRERVKLALGITGEGDGRKEGGEHHV
jgi:cytochrome c biogenesis protein